MEIRTGLTIQEKLHILADAAKYDVVCTSSGADRRGKNGFLGNSVACGICHSFASDGRCISLLKILMTNHCIYDCKYCMNRVSNDVVRTTFTPEEICQLTIEFYKRNYIEGLFLSSGILKSPSYTMERMCETLTLLRTVYRFNGYIHVKVIPGAPDELLARAGYLADRVSVNMELPTAEDLKKLAPNKSQKNILDPMGRMANTIAAHREAIGKNGRLERSTSNQYLERSIFKPTSDRISSRSVPANERTGKVQAFPDLSVSERDTIYELPESIRKENLHRPFASAGQSTQMIIGATQETDFQLLKTSQALYQHFDLKRVFYSAYIPLNEDSSLPEIGTPPPLLREHRLYQADWLLRFYGFEADELLSLQKPDFNEQLDPKCDWALRHLQLFPVEINRAPYDMILRIPGIGPKSATRILHARRYGSLDFTALNKMGVVLKRAQYFITCGGKMLHHIPIEESYIMNRLTDTYRKENWEITHGAAYHQMSLFEDFHLQA